MAATQAKPMKGPNGEITSIHKQGGMIVFNIYLDVLIDEIYDK